MTGSRPGERNTSRWVTHRIAAEVENALWLTSAAGGGLTVAQAAARLGLTEDGLRKNMERAEAKQGTR